MGVLGNDAVEPHEVRAYLGDTWGEMTLPQQADFVTWAIANPRTDWDARIQEITARPNVRVGDVAEQVFRRTEIALLLTALRMVCEGLMHMEARYLCLPHEGMLAEDWDTLAETLVSSEHANTVLTSLVAADAASVYGVITEAVFTPEGFALSAE